MTEGTDRFARQSGLLSTDRLQTTAATIIGVGAIGRQLALQLAALGVGQLRLIDPDQVEASNVTTQGYPASMVGQTKVTAAAAAIRELDPHIVVETQVSRYRWSRDEHAVVFCCVDSIATRAAIWRTLERRVEFWGDGRMRGEVSRVLSVVDDRGRQQYTESLFPPQEAQLGSCTTRGLIYPAAIAAGLMASQLARWLRGMRPEVDVSCNLLANELVVA